VWVPAAVGERTGAVFRLQRPVGDWGQVHAGSAASNAAEAASHDNFLPGDSSVDDVVVVRVTDIVQAAAAIKIDVEGSEAAAMRSCERLLLDPALKLATIEFQGSLDADYSEGLFAQLLQGGMSAYIFQEEYFRFTQQLDLICVVAVFVLPDHRIFRYPASATSSTTITNTNTATVNSDNTTTTAIITLPLLLSDISLHVPLLLPLTCSQEHPILFPPLAGVSHHAHHTI